MGLFKQKEEVKEQEVSPIVNEIIGKPKLIGIVANVNEGKSNLIYHIIDNVKVNYKTRLYAYGLRCEVEGVETIYSVEELESIQNSVIIIDEFMSLFDLDDRHQKRMIENTFRLVNHNNNILILCGLAENYKKFISNKLDMIMLKKVSFGDFINGSRIKKVCQNYCGMEKGSTVLMLEKDEVVFYDGKNYRKHPIPYMEKYDSKKNNVPIFVKK